MDKSQRRLVAIGALGAALFCFGVGLMIRSCEMARMTHVSVVDKDYEIWRTLYAAR